MIDKDIKSKIELLLSSTDEKKININLETILANSEFEQNTLWLLKQLSRPILCTQTSDNPFLILEEIFKKNAIIEELKPLLENSNCLAMKAKYNDCLWTFQRDYEAAKKAAALYLTIIDQINIDSLNINRILCRVFSITITTGNQDIKINTINKTKEILEKKKGQEDYTSYNILKECLIHKILNTDEIIIFCKKFEELITKNKRLKIDFLELIDKLIPKNSEDKRQIERKKATLYKELAEDSRHPAEKVTLLKKAYKSLKQLPGTEQERLELRKDLSISQHELLGTMHSISYEADISNHVKYVQESIKALNPEEYFEYFLLQICIFEKEDIKQKMMENYLTSLRGMFPVDILDHNGRTVAYVPELNIKDEKTILPNMENYIKTYYEYYTNGYLAIIINEFLRIGASFESDVDALIENCYLIPPNRKLAFKCGMIAGFKKDYLTALHILIPQIENGFRCLAEDCGDVGYSIKEDGFETARTFHDLLESQIVKECIDENILFNMKAIFTSSHGLNMRNEQAHGLIDDAYFNSWEALYTWCFIMRLCFIFSSIDKEKILKIKEKLSDINFITPTQNSTENQTLSE